jgi:hypothetical protein
LAQTSTTTLGQPSAKILIFLTSHQANYSMQSSSLAPLEPLEPPQPLHLGLAAAPALEQPLARMLKTQTPKKKQDP